MCKLKHQPLLCVLLLGIVSAERLWSV